MGLSVCIDLWEQQEGGTGESSGYEGWAEGEEGGVEDAGGHFRVVWWYVVGW